MDARDSSSSSATVGNRDGSSSAGEDDGVLSFTAPLAKEAASHFQSGKYFECVEVLNQILQKKKDDPKVLHNTAIAEYFRDGCSDPRRLLEVLNSVKKRSEELTRASGEEVEAVSNIGNTVISGSKGGNTMAHQSSATNSATIVYLDEYDTSVATLNIAVIWFHLHEYAKASSALEPLYQNIGLIDEATALHVCFLLLDAGLARPDASKSADVLLHLEKAFGVSCTSLDDHGGIVQQQQSGNLGAKSSVVPSNSAAPESSNSDLASSISPSESTSLSRTLSDESEYESMLSSLNLSGQNLSRQANDLSRTIVDRSISTTDLKLKLQLYKVQFLLLTRNLKQAKREVKHVMNIARGKESTALLLKSQLEYARGNHHKAIKLLMASSNRTDTGVSSMFNNNLGCIYYQLGNYHTSSIFFSRALSNSSSIRKEKPLKLSTFSQDKSHLIIYNCGVQCLTCGKPFLAARCLQKSCLIFYNRPLLWLRLAECCLMALESGHTEKPDQDTSQRLDVKLHVVGNGKWRQLELEDGTSRNDWYLGNDGWPNLSMSLARQCLLNAQYLLNCSESNYLHSDNTSLEEKTDSSEPATSKSIKHKNLHGTDANGDVKEQKSAIMTQELVQYSLSHYEEISRRENQLIKQALLANLAYVELELGNPLKALTIARTLLDLSEISNKVYIFLGHVYAAESLCLLNRPKEAADHLLMYLSGGNDFELPFSLEDCKQWRADKIADCEDVNGRSNDSQGIVFLKPEEARAILYANFAAVSAVQGDLEQARQFVTEALSRIPNRPEAVLTAVYLDLMLGKSQEAIAKLKQCTCVRFLPSALKLNT